MAKKILTIIFIIIILATLGVLIAFLVIKDSPQGQSVMKNVGEYFPFGKTPVTNTSNGSGDQTTNNSTNTDTNLTEKVVIPRFRKVSNFPVSGATAITSKIGTTTETTIQYVERATGNIFTTKTTSLVSTRISNTTIPKIYETFWTNNGSAMLARYLNNNFEDVETWYAKLVPSNSTSSEAVAKKLETKPLPINIKSIAVSPKQTKIFYTISNASGIDGILANTDGGNPVKIFNSPLKEWLTQWPSENIIAFTTKASSGIDGYLYFLNISTGTFENILRNIKGLTTIVNSNASRILYSESSREEFGTYTYKIGDSPKKISLNTFPEKCIWSKLDPAIIYCGVPKKLGGNLPDMWYKGLVTFSDNIWNINTNTGSTTLIASPSDFGFDNIDLIEPTLTENEDHLIFMDKNSMNLWSLRVASDTN